MKDLIKQLSSLSSFSLSEEELLDFCNDFSDIIPLVNKISEFSDCDTLHTQEKHFNNLREDISEKSDFNYLTKKVTRIIT